MHREARALPVHHPDRPSWGSHARARVDPVAPSRYGPGGRTTRFLVQGGRPGNAHALRRAGEALRQRPESKAEQGIAGDMEQVIGLALPFFGLIFIGFFCGKVRRLPADGLAWLNFFIIYVSLPALFFQLLAKTPIEELANAGFVAITTASTATAFCVSLGIGLLFTRGSLRESTIVAVAGAYSNIGYMGPGLTLATLGPSATVPTALIFCFDNIFFFAMAPLLMALAGQGGEPPLKMAATIAKRILLHPFILATIVGVVAAAVKFQPPGPIEKMLGWLAGAAAPCALFTLGVTVALRPLKRVSAEIPLVLMVKLVLHPLLVFAVLDLVGGFDKVWLTTAVLMASLPPALNVFVIAQQYQVYVERASSIVLIGTVISVVTLTTVLYWITHDMLPIGVFAH